MEEVGEALTARKIDLDENEERVVGTSLNESEARILNFKAKINPQIFTDFLEDIFL